MLIENLRGDQLDHRIQASNGIGRSIGPTRRTERLPLAIFSEFLAGEKIFMSAIVGTCRQGGSLWRPNRPPQSLGFSDRSEIVMST
jgi:hypothetical protein